MDSLNHHCPHRTMQVLTRSTAYVDNEEGQQSDFNQSLPLATCQIHDQILNHERNERTSSSAACSHSCNRGPKQKRIYRYSTFYTAAIAFIILQAPLTSSAHFSPILPIISSSFVSNHCYDSSYCSVSKTDKNANVKKSRQKSNTRVNGNFESVCGFGRILYNTKMETEADTESMFRRKRKRFLRSINYRPVRYDYTSMRSSLLDDEVITNTNSSDQSLLSIDPMVPEEETYLSLMREQDIKRKLTQAINTVWKMNSNETTDKNGNNLIEAVSGKLEVNPGPTKRITIRNLWKRRHARSIEEGIRRERIEPITTEDQLTSVLGETTQSSLEKDGSEPKKRKERRFAARTIAGLISALAEEATGLEVEVNARNDTPFWGKEIDDVQINFSRLGVNALKMGGLDEALNDVSQELSPSVKESMADSIEQEARKVYRDVDFNELGSGNVSTRASDDIFDLIDVDNSGALDEEELTRALSIASGLPTDSDNDKPSEALSKLASRLVKIYDTNGDGVVDREEYKRLVKDMSAVRKSQKMKEKEREEKRQERLERKGGFHPLRMVKSIGHTLEKWSAKDRMQEDDSTQIVDEKVVQGENFLNALPKENGTGIDFASAEDISDETVIDTLSKGDGSIVFTDLKLDLRRLLFGAVPLVKHVSRMQCLN